MRTNVSEHNFVDSNVIKHTAGDLRLLFAFDAPQPALSSQTTTEKSPPLVDSIESVPPVSIDSVSPNTDIYAIDGGSSVMAKGGNVEVICWRAGYTHFKGIERVGELSTPTKVMAYNRLSAGQILNEQLTDTDFSYTSEEPPLRIIDELRWSAEWTLLKQLILDAPEDSLILVDGSLRVNPSFDAESQHELFLQAAKHKIHIAAVTKTSSMSLDHTIPLDLLRSDSDNSIWYRKLNKALPQNSPWLGDIFLARLHSGAEKNFRIDVNRYDTDSIDAIFAMMSSVADDTEFTGYPYPLAAAHRLARIDTVYKQSILDALGMELERKGFPGGLWQYLAGDIHDKLNADIMELTEHGQ